MQRMTSKETKESKMSQEEGATPKNGDLVETGEAAETAEAAESAESAGAPEAAGTPEAAEGAEAAATPEVAEKAPSVRKTTRWEVYFPRGVKEDRKAIYIASFPPIIYFWPAILTFFCCGFLQKVTDIEPGTLGWIAILVFAFNVLVTVQDFDQKKFLILVLVIVVVWLGIWIINMKGYEFLKNFVGLLIGLNPTLSPSAFFLFGLVLALLLGWGLLRPMFDYWKFEHNEFVHYIQPFGRDMSIPRMGSTVTKQIPDILEYVLTFGGGSIVIKREGHVWATIPHIPFLGRRMKAIEKMLSETRVTTIEQ